MLNQQKSYNFISEDAKLWKLDYPPIRNIILWGYNTINKNPSLLFLYGEHQFSNVSDNRKLLADDVEYTNYAIFEGRNGHMPPIPKTLIFTNYNEQLINSNMYYKSDISKSDFWLWRYNKKEFSGRLVESYKKLNKKIKIPYFKFKTYKPIERYKKYIQILKEKGIKFINFELIENPIKFLDLGDEETLVYETIFDAINSNNIYIRKKRLNEFININSKKETYNKLLKIGNVEFISGLLLELAKRKNSILIEEAKYIYSTNDLWSEAKYMKGLKRCALIYINTFDETNKKEVIKNIRKNINQLIPKHTPYFYAFSKRYDRFEKNVYNDGKYFIDSEIKNTLQSAEIFQLTDILGKVAYYFDSPKLSQSFYCKKERKKFNYYKKYIRRAINYIAEENPDKFMEIMRILLTSYKLEDAFNFDDFSSNKFILFYLYYDNSDILNAEGRHEYKKEIWDSHIEDVIYIVKNTQILVIQKACYYIIKDALENCRMPQLSYYDLILLSQLEYKPISTMFNNILMSKINDSTTFDSKLMTALMSGKTETLHNLATQYFIKTNGKFTPEDLVELLKSKNIEIWTKLFDESLKRLNYEEYILFVKEITNNSDYFIKSKIEMSENILTSLETSIESLKNMPLMLKQNLIEYFVNEILINKIRPDFILDFMENLIFSLSYDELHEIFKNINFKQNDIIYEKYLKYVSIFEAIKYESIPHDSIIISILESGKSKMLKLLIELCEKFAPSLDTKFSTLLIMLESNVYRLNELAKKVFETTNIENQKKLHTFILDSPVNKVYKYGLQKLDEIYQNEIPKEFIIQLLEHTAPEVKSYISNKTNDIIDNMGYGNIELYIYYIKTLLYLPNKISKSKDNIYKTIPIFIKLNPQKKSEIQKILLDIGSSNIKIDSERALVTFAKINSL